MRTACFIVAIVACVQPVHADEEDARIDLEESVSAFMQNQLAADKYAVLYKGLHFAQEEKLPEFVTEFSGMTAINSGAIRTDRLIEPMRKFGLKKRIGVLRNKGDFSVIAGYRNDSTVKDLDTEERTRVNLSYDIDPFIAAFLNPAGIKAGDASPLDPPTILRPQQLVFAKHVPGGVLGVWQLSRKYRMYQIAKFSKSDGWMPVEVETLELDKDASFKNGFPFKDGRVSSRSRISWRELEEDLYFPEVIEIESRGLYSKDTELLQLRMFWRLGRLVDREIFTKEGLQLAHRHPAFGRVPEQLNKN